MNAKNLILSLSVAAFGLASCHCGVTTQTTATLKNATDTASYYLGYSNGHQLMQLGIKLEALVAGMNAAFAKEEAPATPMKMNMYIQGHVQKMMQQKAENAKKEGEKFLAENGKKQGVKTTASGLQYKIEKEGTGVLPADTSVVKVHYKGTLLDGTEFDSSYKRGEPAEFPVNRVIAGWTEALQLMPVGSKWTLYIPSDLAYGPRGTQGAIGPNETLIFEVELLDIVDPNAPAADK